jgi:hypothetical protein
MAFASSVDYLPLVFVVLLHRLLPSVYPDVPHLFTYCGMRCPNGLNLVIIATGMHPRDMFCLLTYCPVRRPNSLNLDVISNSALSLLCATI